MQNKLIKAILITTIVCSIIAGYFYSQREYINGNVLHMSIMARNAKNNSIPSPWSQAGMLSGFMYRTLLIADASLVNVKPELASSYEVIDDGLTIKINLKTEQKWSDNTPITPQDVVFSVESLLKSKDVHVSTLLAKAFRNIKYMSIEGNNIIFTLWEADFNFLPALAQFAPMPKHALENTDMAHFHADSFWENPVVSGMYKLDSIEPNSHFTLIPNEYYGATKPKIEKVILYMYNNPNPVDLFYTNSISEMVDYRAMKSYSEFPVEMLFYRYFVFSVQGEDGYTNPRLQDKRVREAICLAINNEDLVSKIYFQLGNASKSTLAGSEGFYDYNPTRAKELLLEANYNFENPLRLAYYYTDSTSQNVMNYLKNNLEDVGFKVELIQVATELDKLYTDRKYDVLFKGLASFHNLEWYEEYDSDHPFLPNIIDTKEAFNPLLQQAATTVDPVLHKEILAQLSALDKEYLFKFPIYSPIQVMYINTDRLSLPKGITFANPWYSSDLNIANWEIRKH